MPRTETAAADDWRPATGLETLKIRAGLLARIRSFFAREGVLEVDTPLLGRAASSDPALDSFATRYTGPGAAGGLPLYLQTSPEFFMKRLLAAGSGAIYQLGHVFRDGEAGARHNPEFMLLEWYRPGLTPAALMDEIDRLLAEVLDGYLEYRPARRISYRDWFLQETGLDPWHDPVEDFRAFAERNLATLPPAMGDDLDAWLDLLLSHWLEPRIQEQALFVCDYPPSQASLARIRPGERAVAERFELYLQGVELANGFHELADAQEQRRRFEQDNRRRQRQGRERLPVDERLLAALAAGLPDCSGVALGFDRLLMLAAGLPDLAATMPFPLGRL